MTGLIITALGASPTTVSISHTEKRRGSRLLPDSDYQCQARLCCNPQFLYEPATAAPRVGLLRIGSEFEIGTCSGVLLPERDGRRLPNGAVNSKPCYIPAPSPYGIITYGNTHSSCSSKMSCTSGMMARKSRLLRASSSSGGSTSDVGSVRSKRNRRGRKQGTSRM